MREQWVICLNCGKRYFLESYNSSGCPVCSSKEYEDDDDIFDEDIEKILE